MALLCSVPCNIETWPGMLGVLYRGGWRCESRLDFCTAWIGMDGSSLHTGGFGKCLEWLGRKGW